MRSIGKILILLLLAFVSAGFAFARGEQPADQGKVAGEVPAGKWGQAPMLAQMVANGELPPVDQRLPPEPMVRLTAAEIGKYGGTLYTSARGPDPWNDVADATEVSPRFFQQGFDGALNPGLLMDWESNDDFTVWTFYVRPGMRWSDGEPITTDEFVFVINDMFLMTDQGIEAWNFVYADHESARQIDEWTYEVTFQQSIPNLPIEYAGPAGGSWFGVVPAHYLKKWHINYNDDADALAQEEGFETWDEAFFSHQWFDPIEDFDRPTFHAWRVVSADTVQKIQERNPYYFVVDKAGNQLPYIDKVINTITDPEGYDLRIISGESDISMLFTAFENFTLYRENEAAGDYTTHIAPGMLGAELALQFNLNNANPAKQAIYQERDFRVAMSYAINRDEINDVVYTGQGVPRQATVPSHWIHFQQKWADSHAQYDPAQANRLLDGIGLSKRDGEGFRLLPNGESFLVTIIHPATEIGGGRGKLLELVKEYWEDVGVRTEIQGLEGGFYGEITDSPDFDANARAFEKLPFHLSVQRENDFAPLWSQWLNAHYDIEAGLAQIEDFEGGVLPGEEPPQWAKDYDRLWFDSFKHAEDSPEYKALIDEAMEFAMDQLFWIGTVGEVPILVPAKNSLGNVPVRFVPRQVWNGALNEFVDALYFKQ